jgi:hypothetical protein
MGICLAMGARSGSLVMREALRVAASEAEGQRTKEQGKISARENRLEGKRFSHGQFDRSAGAKRRGQVGLLRSK